MYSVKQAGIDEDKVNVNGGAIALGHPLGCTGAKLTTQLAYELRRRGGKYGIVAMCIGGGMGAAAVFENLGYLTGGAEGGSRPVECFVDLRKQRVPMVGELSLQVQEIGDVIREQ